MGIETIVQIAYMAVVTLGLIISLIVNFKKKPKTEKEDLTAVKSKLENYINQVWNNIQTDCTECGLTFNAKELVKTAKNLINKFKK